MIGTTLELIDSVNLQNPTRLTRLQFVLNLPHNAHFPDGGVGEGEGELVAVGGDPNGGT